ncbi:nuclear polyadenylated RNA-binding protein 3-like [Malania oleifera]|uniref:nuclear polyadenylated RNA-binding protein 3-like n=1 Tax=Malania oleifera TaxID=397392 RepID=UPI0025AE1D92|nr:nuclear polyadenylated RNA-binding protein 3-like [Malania oleifera]
MSHKNQESNENDDEEEATSEDGEDEGEAEEKGEDVGDDEEHTEEKEEEEDYNIFIEIMECKSARDIRDELDRKYGNTQEKKTATRKAPSSNDQVVAIHELTNLADEELDVTKPSELFIKHTRYDLFNSTTLKQMGYDKSDQGWYLKGGRPQRAPVGVPPPPPPTQDQGPSAEIPFWPMPFYREFSTFNRDMSSSRGDDPMYTSSPPRSDDEDTEESEEEEGDEDAEKDNDDDANN